MNKFFNKLIEILLILSTKKRRLILILTDCLLISSSLWTIYFFSIEESSKLLNIKDTFELNIILLLIGIVIYSTTGQYKSLIKYLNSKSLYNILFRNFLLTLLFSSFSNFLNYPFL